MYVVQTQAHKMTILSFKSLFTELKVLYNFNLCLCDSAWAMHFQFMNHELQAAEIISLHLDNKKVKAFECEMKK